MYHFHYADLNTHQLKEYRRPSLWTNEELREHLHSLLRVQTAIPGFFGFTAHGRSSGAHIAVDIFRQNVVIGQFVVVTKNDNFSREEFGVLASRRPAGREMQEPTAPYCASHLIGPQENHLFELEWISDYERCVGWEWRHIQSTAEGSASITP
jgi:hypothetical protein